MKYVIIAAALMISCGNKQGKQGDIVADTTSVHDVDTPKIELPTHTDSVIIAFEYRGKAMDLISQYDKQTIHWQYTQSDEHKRNIIRLRKQIARYYDSSYMYDRNEECKKVAASYRTKIIFVKNPIPLTN